MNDGHDFCMTNPPRATNIEFWAAVTSSLVFRRLRLLDLSQSDGVAAFEQLVWIGGPFWFADGLTSAHMKDAPDVNDMSEMSDRSCMNDEHDFVIIST